MKNNILITGQPKSGKSTLLQNIIAPISNKVGFITHEVRESGNRVGFEIETFLGTKTMLAHVALETEYQVGRFFVSKDNLESILPEVSTFSVDALLYIDEIGQMQVYSPAFRELVTSYLDAPNTCLATISVVSDDPFIAELRKREDCLIIQITEENRDEQELFVRGLCDE